MEASKLQLYTVFDVQRPCHAQGLQWTPRNCNVTRVFAFNVHFARKSCSKIAIVHEFLTFNVHFARMGCSGHLMCSRFISCERLQRSSKLQFDFGFGRPTCAKCCACHVSWHFIATACAYREKERKKERAREGEREREDLQICRCRSADVGM